MELWRVLSAVSYGERVNVGYGGETVFPEDEEVTPLDPIDPDLVGGAKVKELFTFAKVFQLTVLTALLAVLMPAEAAPPPDWLKKNFKLGQYRDRPVNGRYKDHMKTLLAVKLLKTVHPKNISFISTYFGVPKTRATSRSIFNGKRLSRNTPPPPPVNLMTTSQLVHETEKIAIEGKRVEVYAGDLRHWFHQIPAPLQLQETFGLRLASDYYVWMSLPMGWSWSPALAQATAWAWIMWRGLDQKPLFQEDAFKVGTGLPRLVRTISGKGFVTVYYDNFIIVSSDANEVDEIRRRLQNNSHHLHVWIKEGSEVRARSKDVQEVGYTHLGIHFQALKDPKRPRDTCGIRWWPAKSKEWEESAAEYGEVWNNTASCAKAASVLGRTLFGLCLDKSRLHSTPVGQHAVRLAQTLGRAAYKGGWKATMPAIGSDLRRVYAHVGQLHVNPYITGQETGPRREFAKDVLCSDASTSTGWGWMSMRPAGEGRWAAVSEGRDTAGRWGPGESRHIFLLELETALRALRHWASMSDKKVRLVVDNAAVAFTLTAGVTNSVEGMRMLQEYGDVLDFIHDVVLVGTADNPSDCGSRGNWSDFETRVSNVSRALDAHTRGWLWASCRIADWQGEWTAVRHQGPTDVEAAGELPDDE